MLKRLSSIPLAFSTASLAAFITSSVLCILWCGTAASTPTDDWSLAEMVAHLHEAGLKLRLVSTREDGIIRRNAFLTATDKEWRELNHLSMVREKIAVWQGTLYVEKRLPAEDVDIAAELGGDCCLVVGSFFFFGDAELLARVRDFFAKL